MLKMCQFFVIIEKVYPFVSIRVLVCWLQGVFFLVFYVYSVHLNERVDIQQGPCLLPSSALDPFTLYVPFIIMT